MDNLIQRKEDMDRQPSFAAQFDTYARRAGFVRQPKPGDPLEVNYYKISLAIGLLPGMVGFSAKQVSRLAKEEQRPSTPGLIARLVVIFGLADYEADRFWYAAGTIPDDWEFETFHQAAESQRQRAGKTWPLDDRRTGRDRRDRQHRDAEEEDDQPNGQVA